MKKISIILVAISLSTIVFAAGKVSPDASVKKTISVTATSTDFITGNVVDKNTKESLAGVVVVCDNQKTYTDLDGNFKIQKSKKASELTVQLISYSTITLKINEIQDGCVSISLRQR